MTLWPESVDEILTGDQAVVLAYVTPASGVVLTPVTNFGIRDRVRNTVTVNSSIGAWKKLERIGRNPHVALVYHTRQHGFSDRFEYALLQGTATLSPPDANYPEAIRGHWERFVGPIASGPIWSRWLRVYHTRVAIELKVERAVVWPDLTCRGAPDIYGAALPNPPEPQRPPGRGVKPRVNHRRAAKKARQLSNVLLGWVGTDGFPVAVPIETTRAVPAGIVLEPAPAIVPGGGRRAGLIAHSFTRYVRGQHQRIYTGWLDAGPDGHDLLYAPHTQTGHDLPPSKLLYNLAVGYATRRWRRGDNRPEASAPQRFKAGASARRGR